MLKRAHAHRGASFVEILPNSNIFNDGAFNDVSDKALKADHQSVLQHGKPLINGKNRDMGIRMNGMRPEAVQLGGSVTEKTSSYTTGTNLSLAFMLGNFEPPLPTPVGVFYAVSRPTYDGAVEQAARRRKSKAGRRRPENAARQGRYVDGDQLSGKHSQRTQKGPRAQSHGPFVLISKRQSRFVRLDEREQLAGNILRTLIVGAVAFVQIFVSRCRPL